MSSAAPLLSVADLRIGFPGPGGGRIEVLHGVSFTVDRGEVVGLLGESGSGKSLTALAVLGLLPPAAQVSGRVSLDAAEDGDGGGDLLRRTPGELRRVRGRRIGMIFQEPGLALNPVLSVGFQVAEAVRVHRSLSRRAARGEAERLLAQVALPEPGRRMADYPHQLSGGQKQRVMIAIALAGEPDLLLADEPTTALDVTVQAQILALLVDLQRQLRLAVLLITHDFGVVAEVCDRAVVLDAGSVVEEAPVERLFAAPAHPATRRLLAVLPRLPRLPTPARSAISA